MWHPNYAGSRCHPSTTYTTTTKPKTKTKRMTGFPIAKSHLSSSHRSGCGQKWKMTMHTSEGSSASISEPGKLQATKHQFHGSYKHNINFISFLHVGYSTVNMCKLYTGNYFTVLSKLPQAAACSRGGLVWAVASYIFFPSYFFHSACRPSHPHTMAPATHSFA